MVAQKCNIYILKKKNGCWAVSGSILSTAGVLLVWLQIGVWFVLRLARWQSEIYYMADRCWVWVNHRVPNRNKAKFNQKS